MIVRKVVRALAIVLVVLAVLVLAATALIVWEIRASLPALDGRENLQGLEAHVAIARDALGVPDIHASNRLDASRALGFLHAQDRFFQMDLLRRRGAGELAALFGPALVAHDRQTRRHGFRTLARTVVDRLPPRHRAILDAYVDGVNAGLNALGARPPEYLLLRLRPEPWRPEDSLLVACAMFFTLQDSTGHGDLSRAAASRALPPQALEFFFPAGTDWDAPLDASTLSVAPIPGPEVLDFRTVPKTSAQATFGVERPLRPGSNSWGVDGASSATGAAIVANDMHLDLGLPNIWYRVCLRWAQPDGSDRRIVGVSLPGVPALVVGSNGDVAWAFTNATLDTTDVVIIELDPNDPSRYRTPEGWRSFDQVRETIAVRGEPPREIHFEQTLWGPVIGEAGPGRKFALSWIPQHAEALNLNLLEIESARTADEAMDLAPTCGIPVQNLLVGDRTGALGWTLMGRFPRRAGFDGRVPVSWADGQRRWEGWLEAATCPRFIGPPGSRLWTANNRIAGSAGYLALGTWDTDPGARARQIRDDLTALPAKTDEAGLLGIHRDDRALFLARWQTLLLHVLEKGHAGTNATRWSTLGRHVENWGGRAAVESIGYRLVRAFRNTVIQRICEPIVTQCRTEDPGFDYGNDRQDRPVWALLDNRPPHLLNPRFADYDALLADAVNAILADLDRQGVSLDQASWGARNTLAMQHPLSTALPRLASWLDLPATPLPGDDHMPRVQGRNFGPSERIVVSPGHEERGLFHMPGGQSGHFLSPFYRAGHEAWVSVEPTPLLPGPTLHQLVLSPRPQ